MNSGMLPNSTTPCSAVTLQTKIPGLPCLDYQSCPNFCLPGGFTILLTAEPAAPGTTSGCTTSVPISILSAWATTCCLSSFARSKAFPPRQVPCCDYTATNQAVISADSALVALLRTKVKRSWVRCLLWGSSEYLQEAVALDHIRLYQEANRIKHLHSAILLISHSIQGIKHLPWAYASQDTSWLMPASHGCHMSFLSWQWPFKMHLQAVSLWLKPVPPVLLHFT